MTTRREYPSSMLHALEGHKPMADTTITVMLHALEGHKPMADTTITVRLSKRAALRICLGMLALQVARYFLGCRIEVEEAQNEVKCEGRRPVVFNPCGRPLDKLPVIYGFNNGSSPGCFSAVAVAEDGTGLGGHICSNEGYMPHELGVIENAQQDLHRKNYQKHYPNGYRMEFVPSDEMAAHAGFQAMLIRANAKVEAEKPDNLCVFFAAAETPSTE